MRVAALERLILQKNGGIINKMKKDIKVDSEIFNDFLNLSENTLLIKCGSGGKIIKHNKSLNKMLENLSEINNISDVFLTMESKDFNLKEVFRKEKENQIILKSKKNDLVHFYAFKTGDEFLFIGETIGRSDDKIIEKLSSLNNEVINITRELRSKNIELEKANKKISELSHKDPLTDLYNRRYLEEEAKKLLSLSRRHELPLSLVLSDLDDFKKINDEFGHSEGDEVLKLFAGIIKKNCRIEDIPVRFGGEEFMLILPQTEIKSGYIMAERIRNKLFNTNLPEINKTISASFGVSQFRGEKSLDPIIKRADLALYRSKEKGGNKTTAIN